MTTTTITPQKEKRTLKSYFPIADAVFSQDAERQKWLQKVKDWLWQGRTQHVIQACQQ